MKSMALSILLLLGLSTFSQTNPPTYQYGLFENARDIGAVKHPGSSVYDAAQKTYTIAGEPLQSAGGSFRIRFTEPFYLGLGVCAHDNNAIEKAAFSNVESKQRPAPIVESTLESVPISSKDRKVVYPKRAHFEAQNWSRDGKDLYFQQAIRIMKLPVLPVTPTGFGEIQVLAKLFGSQGTINVPSWSPDSKQLAFVSYRLIEQ